MSQLEYSYLRIENLIVYLSRKKRFEIVDDMIKYVKPEDCQPLCAIIETYKLQYLKG